MSLILLNKFKFNRFANKVIDKLLSENKDTYDKYKEFFLMYEYPETDNLSKMKVYQNML